MYFNIFIQIHAEAHDCIPNNVYYDSAYTRTLLCITDDDDDDDDNIVNRTRRRV